MRSLRAAKALAAACIVAVTLDVLAADDGIDLVPIASLTFDGDFVTPWRPLREQGQPTVVHGVLRLPPGDARVPGVLLLHGCGGIGSGETAWARWLRDRGHATLIVNAFSGRGIASVCHGTHALNVASSLADVAAAAQALARHPRVDASRLAVLGFSTGGRAALWSAHARLREAHGDSLRFAAHIAFYPDACMVRLADAPDAGTTIRVLHGSDDDWTPIDACAAMVGRWRDAGADAALLAYEGAPHGFDHPDLAARRVPTIVNLGGCRFAERDGRIVDVAGATASYASPCVRRGGRIGHDAASHERARRDVERILAEAFARPATPRSSGPLR